MSTEPRTQPQTFLSRLSLGKTDLKPFLWKGRIAPAFWTITGSLSLVVNIILVVALIIVAKQLFTIKAMVGDQLVGGLYDNFVAMDAASIKTSVDVSTTIPVKFDLPVVTNTTVTLTSDTEIRGARVSLFTGGLTINNAPTDIILPAGTVLPIALNITVPVDTTVPVQLNVPVDIPLQQTELHEPFVGLQNVVAPYRSMLDGLPDSWGEVFCAKDAQGNCINRR